MPKLKSGLNGQEQRQHLTDDSTLNRAFQLAHSIFQFRDRDRKTALETVWEAFKSVDVRLVAQHEADRHGPERASKARWDTGQWFQLLIYFKSETYEVEQETHDLRSLSQTDMAIRFVKHLILTSCRRNSFHVSLGLSRLIYDYRAAESMAIYDLIFQDPDSSTRKADAYYRARKNKLIDELAKRFGSRVKIREGSRGEKMFVKQEDSQPYHTLITDYLMRFTPWGTVCEVPQGLTTWMPIPALQNSQTNQIHSLIHPPCFKKLINALQLEPPEESLALPKFFLRSSQDDATAPTGTNESSLTESEKAELKQRLSDERRRRKDWHPRTVSIRIDGVERARVDLTRLNQIRIDGLKADATLVEMVGTDEDGDLLLGSHLLTSESNQGKYSLNLSAGQKLHLTGTYDRSETVLSILVAYEAAAEVVDLPRANRLKKWCSSLSSNWAGVSALARITAVGAFLLFAAFILYLGFRDREDQKLAQVHSNSNKNAGSVPSLQISPPDSGVRVAPSPTPVKAQPSPSNRFKSRGETREQTERPVQSLANVERIYVGPLGNDAFNQALQQKLREKLKNVVLEPDEADTAISGSFTQTGVIRDEVTNVDVAIGNGSFRLINISGDMIWRSRKYAGTVDQITSEFARDLAQALAARKKQRN